jgi:hypothetical protein
LYCSRRLEEPTLAPGAHLSWRTVPGSAGEVEGAGSIVGLWLQRKHQTLIGDCTGPIRAAQDIDNTIYIDSGDAMQR